MQVVPKRRRGFLQTVQAETVAAVAVLHLLQLGSHPRHLLEVLSALYPEGQEE